jgi:hypothetical protein
MIRSPCRRASEKADEEIGKLERGEATFSSPNPMARRTVQRGGRRVDRRNYLPACIAPVDHGHVRDAPPSTTLEPGRRAFVEVRDPWEAQAIVREYLAEKLVAERWP